MNINETTVTKRTSTRLHAPALGLGIGRTVCIGTDIGWTVPWQLAIGTGAR